MSGAISLKTLILDGCVLLEHVGPEGLPPSLESFSFDSGSDATRISNISLAGCVHLKTFLLNGAFPGLEELDLSGTSVIKVDLSSKVVQVNRLNKVILMGCKQLRALLWSQEGRQLKVLRIDPHGRNKHTKLPYSDSPLCAQHRNYDGYVIACDARMIQSLLHDVNLITNSIYLHLHNAPPSTSKSKRQSSSSDKDFIPKPLCYSNDPSLEGIPSNDGGEIPWPPPSDRHVEISEGISLTDVEGENEIMAIHTMIVRQVHSLHVHDNSCMLAVNPKSASGGLDINNIEGLFGLRWCRVERCPKLQMVFMPHTVVAYYFFPNMESIWASHLPMATCIWSKGFLSEGLKLHPLPQLQSIHIHNCPRLKFVLPLSPMLELPNLETLHITHCGDLRQVFPWDEVREPRIKEIIGQAGTLKKLFQKLKHIYLHDLPSLHEICEERMWAPMLESIEVRGCWALRRLPAVGFPFLGRRKCIARIDRDCWEKLHWDGIHVAHHPYLYQTRFSSRYYRKQRLHRGTVLR
nr:unnamed protein product [Digitaria exilis]